jgi:AhpD family alkylhydroperoxidase
MTHHYHDPDDTKRFKDMRQLAPKEFEAWVALDRIVGREDGQVPRKYRELIALAVSLTTQCVYCIDAHAKAAKKAGATREEIAETAFLAAALRAGGAAAHGTLALKLYDEASA